MIIIIKVIVIVIAIVIVIVIVIVIIIINKLIKISSENLFTNLHTVLFHRLKL